MSAHGTRTRYQAGCRCDDCRQASAAYTTEWRHRTGRTDPSRWVQPRHGVNRYRNGGCRCVECRAANTAACRLYRAARRERRAS